MDKYQETFDTWNKVASLYQERFMNLDLYNGTYDFVCNAIVNNNAKILEIGCGPGNITRYLLSKKPDLDIFGIDVAPNMIQLAKGSNPTARFAVMDCRNINQISEKYDGIVCGFGLPYLSHHDLPKFVADCCNLMNENAVLYISFVEGDSTKSDFMVNINGDRCYFYFHALDDLITQLIKNNFDQPKVFKVKFEKSEAVFETHTIVITKKTTA